MGDGFAMVYIDNVVLEYNAVLEIEPPTVTFLNPSSVTIEWTTDEDSDTSVEYGTNTSYTSGTKLGSQSSNPPWHHTVTLSSLTLGKTYHYRAISQKSKYSQYATNDLSFT